MLTPAERRRRPVDGHVDGHVDGRAASEAGFTLVEMAIASTVLVLALTLVTGVLSTMFKTGINAERGESTANQVRITMLAFEHDIQSANPLQAESSLAVYPDTIVMTTGPTGSTQQTVTWSYSSTADQLTRAVTSNGTTTTVVELTGVTNGSATVFSYFGQSGINLVTAASANATAVAPCTVRVRVSLVVSVKSAPTVSQSEDIQLGNVTPGSLSCG